MVKGEPRRWITLAPSFGPAAASGLTKQSTGLFCLREPLAFGFAKTTISVASFCAAVASLRGG